MTNTFTVPVLLQPRGHSIDVEWPHLGKLAVLVHDEVMRFKGLKDAVEALDKRHRAGSAEGQKPIKARLTITVEEEA